MFCVLAAQLGGQVLLQAGEVTATDLLERPFAEDAPAFRSALGRGQDGEVELCFRPFEIKTLRIARR